MISCAARQKRVRTYLLEINGELDCTHILRDVSLKRL